MQLKSRPITKQASNGGAPKPETADVRCSRYAECCFSQRATAAWASGSRASAFSLGGAVISSITPFGSVK